MKKTAFFIPFFLFFVTLSAQIPTGYYASAVGKSGDELRTALYLIIRNHNALDYSDLWEAFKLTDRMPSGYVWDIYSDIPDDTADYYFVFDSDKCGGYSHEGDCYNREHTIPQSWFNDATPMKSDLFHIYPTDGWVNNKRGNLAYGTVDAPTWTSTNGSKLGPCSYPGCTGTVFEPIDAFKGDLARSYFYMSVRYKDKNLGQTAESVFSGSQIVDWAASMFMDWHTNDSVSQKEIDRNNVIYSQIQHNRNPFIDCPELADYLFGSRVGERWFPTCFVWDTTGVAAPSYAASESCVVYPNPAQNEVHIISNDSEINMLEICNLSGQTLFLQVGFDSKQAVITLDALSAGCYFVKITTRTRMEVHKLIKK